MEISNLRYYYFAELADVANIARVTDKTKAEIKQIALDAIKSGKDYFSLGIFERIDLKYKISKTPPVCGKLKVEVLEKTSKKPTKNERRYFLIDGKKLTYNEIQEELNTTEGKFYMAMKGVKKARINGRLIESTIKCRWFRIPYLYKSNEVYKNVTFSQAAKIVKCSTTHMKALYKTKQLEKETGWKVSDSYPM